MLPDIDLPSSLYGDGILVSVIVPTYDDADYLPTALESIAAQTHDNVEVILIDSSGVAGLERLADRTEGLEYVFQEPSGPSVARNRGIEEAEGEVVGFLDADDWWVPEKLSQQLSVIERGADIVYSDAYIVENGTKRYFTSLPIDDPTTHEIKFLFEGGIPILTVIARRECLEREPFDDRLSMAEDRNLLVRLLREYTPGRVPKPLAYYNRREDSWSSDPEAMYDAEMESLSSLFERYDDLKCYQGRLESKAHYKYGKRLIRTGRPGDARGHLLSVLLDGPLDFRTAVLFGVSLLPTGNARTLVALERLQERLR